MKRQNNSKFRKESKRQKLEWGQIYLWLEFQKEKRKNRTETIFEEIMAGNFKKLILKKIRPQIQEDKTKVGKIKRNNKTRIKS